MDTTCNDEVRATVTLFLDDWRARHYAPGTIASRAFELSRFTRFLAQAGIGRVRDVSRARLEAYGLALVAQGVSFDTSQRYLAAVRQWLAFLEARSLLFENPMRDMQLRRGRTGLPQVISEAEARALLAAPDTSRRAGRRDRAILELLYSTGIRVGELTALRVADLDLDDRTVRVLGKGRKARVVPVGRKAAEWCGRYLREVRPVWLKRAGVPDLAALFLTNRVEPIPRGAVRNLVRVHARTAGIAASVSPHTLRRSCATHLLRNGATPMAVAHLLGHANMRSLSSYLRVTVTDMKAMHAGSRLGR